MAEERELQKGLVISARYRIERRLGSGGMGSVYLVQHVHTEERLALKVLHKAVIADSNALERFRREARTPARIDSEYVVRVTDADAAAELGGAPFLVMEYLRGQDIDQRLESGGAFSPETTVHLLKQAARALDKAHSLGIVHRDLKPENLFVVEREDGSLVTKILDFGIAKFTANPEEVKVSQATRPGAVFGTPLFMSPEQALDSSKVSTRTDIWALGLIAHRMLTGRDYWTAETLTALIAQIAYEPMVPPSERGSSFGADYDAWFLRCCARDPVARFETAGEAIRALAVALGQGGEAAADSAVRVLSSPLGAVSAKTDVNVLSDTQLATTQLSPEGKSRGGMIGVAAVVLALGGIAAFLAIGRGGGEPTTDGARGAGAATSLPTATVRATAEPVATDVVPAASAPDVVPLGSAGAEPVSSAGAPATSAKPETSAAPRVIPPRQGAGPGPRPPSTGGSGPTPPKTSSPATPPPGKTADPFGSRY
jgi:tRNA A-37 threonylcarbamoyl transferase component Bud32